MTTLPLKALLPSELPSHPLLAGEPSFRRHQLFTWMHRHQAPSFEAMTDLPKAFRAALAADVPLHALELDRELRDSDGTIKFVWKTHDDARIESVFIPEKDRGTLCLSSQVGCGMACAFCKTGLMGFARHLSAPEIIDQVYLARARLPATARLTNLVYMGMGEPLHNYDNVVRSIRLLLDPAGANFSRRHITVSTSGLVPQITRLGRDVPVNLAVSLIAPTDAQRSQIMPVNKRWPLAGLLAACASYPLPPTRRITFEYVLLAGFNDSEPDAHNLVRLLRGQRCKVNLLQFNASQGLPFGRPTDATAEAFREILVRAHISAFIRRSRGLEVGAACGQLGRLPVVHGGPDAVL